jgi:hypothetical protein
MIGVRVGSLDHGEPLENGTAGSWASASDAALWTGPTPSYLPRIPVLDLRPQPEAGAARAEIEHWPWHVFEPALVLAHGVPVGQAEDASDVVGVDELINDDSSSHTPSLHRAADESSRSRLSVRPES